VVNTDEWVGHKRLHAVVVGCEIVWKLLLLDIRYVNGLSKIDKVLGITSIDENTYSICVTLGISLKYLATKIP